MWPSFHHCFSMSPQACPLSRHDIIYFMLLVTTKWGNGIIEKHFSKWNFVKTVIFHNGVWVFAKFFVASWVFCVTVFVSKLSWFLLGYQYFEIWKWHIASYRTVFCRNFKICRTMEYDVAAGAANSYFKKISRVFTLKTGVSGICSCLTSLQK